MASLLSKLSGTAKPTPIETSSMNIPEMCSLKCGKSGLLSEMIKTVS